ncbi:DUF305 domain-containing protein [Orrella sp. JC864]|uniref:CopM family metallochaperone n=1 Tax=Orrella sp. JC864 TaxID=3120298 RepID=UPI0030095154
MHVGKWMAGPAMALLLLGAGAAGAAQDAHGGHGDHGNHDGGVPSGQAAQASPSTRAFEAANARMHRDMAVAYTGDADVDFVRAMIPHHEGAVDMARIVLAHGKDPGIRRLAEDVIRAQQAEIAQMRDWLKARGLD